MTNFSSVKKSEIITPEKSVLFLPIIIGILILSSLLAFVYIPLSKKLSNEKEQTKVLEEKISYIPLYKKYIRELSINTSKAKKQQDRLIELISDPQELNTILSEINRICIENEIEIMNVVPKPIIKYSQSNDNTSTNSVNNDPFLIPSIEKHVFNLTLKGEFNSLLDFLKELELLQAIAITDQIEIKTNPANDLKENLKLTMSFNLSTYARLNSKSNLKLIQ
tara:strand:+ start:3391 stop:4056 length:666 start_codon:yes stop_codon:yes gene_type:complete